jgi:hypothetical protein
LQTQDQKPRNDAYRKYLRYSQVGIQFFAAVGLCTWGGIWLDGKLGTKVLFTLLGLAFGFAGGFYALYLDIYGRKGSGKNNGKDDREGSSGL